MSWVRRRGDATSVPACTDQTGSEESVIADNDAAASGAGAAAGGGGGGGGSDLLVCTLSRPSAWTVRSCYPYIEFTLDWAKRAIGRVRL